HLRKHYRPGTRLATAFALWIEELLGQHGLVVFESADPAGRALVKDVFAHELADPGLTSRLARMAGAAMTTLGHKPQVEPAEDNVALFYVDAEGRRGIKRQGNELIVGTTSHTREELRAEALTNPEKFSPNVLLRPLVQDRLFPTICYVA